MRKRFKKSVLLRVIGQEPSAEEVLHNHAFKKVAHKDGPSLNPRQNTVVERQIISSYQSSMVGSIAQYRDTTIIKAASATKDDDTKADDPANDAAGKKNDQKHHFTEPPKREHR